ncbi:MAG TPA: S8 family peptidase [Thermoanaerobaculia bacterium]|nr:S8 family peptidase [Thermoanaerobaculia bacterium]
MATRKTSRKTSGKKPAPQKIDRDLVEKLLFGTGRVRRFTQDTPVLPDVWLEYARAGKDEEEQLTRRAASVDPADPFPPIKLLLTPFGECFAGDIAKELRGRLGDSVKTARVIYNQSTVAATLSFEDLVRVVLPMTGWWDRLKLGSAIQGMKAEKEKLLQAIQDPERTTFTVKDEDQKDRRLPPDLLWMMRIVGALALLHRGEELPEDLFRPEADQKARNDAWERLVEAVSDLIQGVTPGDRKARIYSVSLNREATLTVARSMLAVKADAARLLFHISCRDLAWAVIDSGIDARHPAFRKRKGGNDSEMIEDAFDDAEGKLANNTRVVATYDFSQIDRLLDPEAARLPEHLEQRLKLSPEKREELEKQLKDLKDALAFGRTLDWGLIAPLLRIPQDEGEERYMPPGNDHGTHVAGILAGNWKAKESGLDEDLSGVCQDLRLYDLRVLDAQGRGDEFSVMAALQLIRHLNSTNDYMTVHGVNLSLSIPHDVSNYACGRTPVCEECERVINSGVVVVAAAGNQGYRKLALAGGGMAEVYNTVSITDPGNAELVITVGATHRYRPHTYGVSYFSSRGPTGDGRLKPDLVAPGEKITSPLPGDSYGLKDGTSMAAPHVSGVAALLMARHEELVGRPARIKQILCATATDLGRERYFQGAGMLDALRALQSV